MHAFIAFDTLRKCKGHILGTLTPAQYRDVRRDIVSLILATDLQQHFEVSCTACLSVALLDYTHNNNRQAIEACIKLDVTSTSRMQEGVHLCQPEWHCSALRPVTCKTA
jgi:hypothetical protein